MLPDGVYSVYETLVILVNLVQESIDHCKKIEKNNYTC